MKREQLKAILDTVLAHVPPHRLARQLGWSVPQLVEARTPLPGIHNVEYPITEKADRFPGETAFYMRNLWGLYCELILALHPEHPAMRAFGECSRIVTGVFNAGVEATAAKQVRAMNALSEQVWKVGVAALPKYDERGGIET